MSSSTAFPASADLTATWKEAVTESKPFRYLQIKIQQEALHLVAKSAGSASVSKDFDELRGLGAGESCYFLFRIAGPKNWILISYVPEGKAKITDKMLYAATKSTLKSKLGPQFINEEAHFTSTDELSYSHYMRSKEPAAAGSALSEFEKARLRVHKEEEEERTFRAEIKAAADVGNSQKIGGYHHVMIPLEENAKVSISELNAGSTSLVELRVKPRSANAIELVTSKSIVNSELAASVRGAEPRFYLYACQNTRSPASSKATVFLYYCPDASPAQLRMVYSTSKPTTAQQIAQLGIQIDKKLEVREGAELTDEYLQCEVFGAPPTPSRTTYKPSSSSSTTAATISRAPMRAPSPANKPAAPLNKVIVGGIGGGPSTFNSNRPGIKPSSLKKGAASPPAHPVYSLMAKGSPSSSGSKKVVMPPPGAYC